MKAIAGAIVVLAGAILAASGVFADNIEIQRGMQVSGMIVGIGGFLFFVFGFCFPKD